MIDLNSDMGESFGAYTIGDDESMLKLVSSANVACGFHGGDPTVMRRTVRLCGQMSVAVGAHPSYPDLQGFGRRNMSMTPEEVYDICLYQVGAIAGFCRATGAVLQHVKPHGALYNQAAKDINLARAIAQAVKDSSNHSDLILLGLANSQLQTAALELSVPFAGEVFADRAYQPDGTLLPRSQPGAVIHSPSEAAQRALQMATRGEVTASDGFTTIKVRAHSICVHGDTKGAVEMALQIKKILEEAGIQIRPIREVIGL